MLVESEGQLQLGADPIGGSNQHRFGHSGHIRLEKPAEPPDIRKDPVDMGLGYDGFDTGNKEIAGIDVHSGFGIRLGSRQGHDPLLN